jgi:hypothetical protein
MADEVEKIKWRGNLLSINLSGIVKNVLTLENFNRRGDGIWWRGAGIAWRLKAERAN